MHTHITNKLTSSMAQSSSWEAWLVKNIPATYKI